MKMLLSSRILICLFMLLFMVLVQADKTEEVVNVLILGGNGLTGSATVRSLLQEKNINYNITLLNRGNWYWDTETLIRPYVHHIECSREDGFRETCTQIADDTVYEVVIDFSAYDPLDIEDILIVLDGRFKKYIYISSDSVYEVCLPKTHNGYSVEEDSVRPTDEEERNDYDGRDSYGHKKLGGEEVLEEYHESMNYSYIALRLPDVIGPRDNTKRFWKYYMWTKLNQIIGPVHIPSHLHEKPLSFVYSLDVGKLIAELVHPDRYSVKVFNQAYNLGFKETITFKGFIQALSDFINKDHVQFDENRDEPLMFGFPSVTRGAVNIDKAQKYLEWTPTNVFKALNETCAYHEEAQYNKKYKYILDRVLDILDVRGEKYRDFLELHYDDHKIKDEL